MASFEIRKTKLNIIPAALAILGLIAILCGAYGLNVNRSMEPPAEVLTTSSYLASPASPAKPTPATPHTDNPPPSQAIADLQQQVDKLSAQVDSLAKYRDVLNDRFTLISQQATHAQWLLTIILGVAGLLTLAQGYFAFFSAQNYVKQADDAIKKVTEIESDVRSKFPYFADLETARSAAFLKLSQLSSVLDRDFENVYAVSKPMDRQEIFAFESFLAMQFLSEANRSEHLVRNLKILGRFYTGKFVYEAPNNSRADLDRGQYYFEVALQKSNRHYSVLNDMGWFYSTESLPIARPELAGALFEESLRSQPAQQRALYNLGTMSFEKGDEEKLKKGIALLLRAKNQANWEDSPDIDMSAHIEYNLACFHDALAAMQTDSTPRNELLDKTVIHLGKAATLGRQSEKLLASELLTGDLQTIGQDIAYAPQVAQILAVYKEAWLRSA